MSLAFFLPSIVVAHVVARECARVCVSASVCAASGSAVCARRLRVCCKIVGRPSNSFVSFSGMSLPLSHRHIRSLDIIWRHIKRTPHQNPAGAMSERRAQAAQAHRHAPGRCLGNAKNIRKTGFWCVCAHRVTEPNASPLYINGFPSSQRHKRRAPFRSSVLFIRSPLRV